MRRKMEHIKATENESKIMSLKLITGLTRYCNKCQGHIYTNKNWDLLKDIYTQIIVIEAHSKGMSMSPTIREYRNGYIAGLRKKSTQIINRAEAKHKKNCGGTINENNRIIK